MVAPYAHEVAQLRERIARLEGEPDHRANVISGLADELAELSRALRVIYVFSEKMGEKMGAACGLGPCTGCLIETTADTALARTGR